MKNGKITVDFTLDDTENIFLACDDTKVVVFIMFTKIYLLAAHWVLMVVFHFQVAISSV